MHSTGAHRVMLATPTKSRQPLRSAWSHEQLIREHAITLGFALDNSMLQTYNSHLQSYLSFCKLHLLNLEPTPDTLSFYIVFMAHHIKLTSVMQYLSGIVNSLEPHFPNIRANCHHILMTRTLVGARKLWGFTGTQHKCALTEDDLLVLLMHPAKDLDEELFNTIVLSTFHALLGLGETTQPDTRSKRTFRKVTLHLSVRLTPTTFSFMLPTHKANHFFESSTILIESRSGLLCPRRPFISYLAARDACFPLHAQLWLRLTGQVPTNSWVVNKMKHTWDSDIGSHSLCSGGATSLALAGTADDHIQAHGHWSSNAYQTYIHNTLLCSSLSSRATQHSTPTCETSLLLFLDLHPLPTSFTIPNFYGHWSHIHTNSAPQHLSMLSLHPTGIEYSTTSSCCMIYITDSTQEKEHSPHC